MLTLFHLEFLLRVLEKTFLSNEYEYYCVGVPCQGRNINQRRTQHYCQHCQSVMGLSVDLIVIEIKAISLTEM